MNRIFAPDELKKSDQTLHLVVDKLWFISPSHLDIQCNEWEIPVWDDAKNFLLQMNTVITPKEKLNCVLNCSKTIIFMINSKGGVAGADDFLPHMIFAVILANPPFIQSNIEYIRLFCSSTNNDDLGESFYYLTILESAVYFLLNLSASALGVSEEELQKHLNQEVPRGEREMLAKKEVKDEEEEDEEEDDKDNHEKSGENENNKSSDQESAYTSLVDIHDILSGPNDDVENVSPVPLQEHTTIDSIEEIKNESLSSVSTDDKPVPSPRLQQQFSFSDNDLDFLGNLGGSGDSDIKEKLQIMEMTVSTIVSN